MNVLIRGADFSNKGAEAMLLTVVEALTRRLPAIAFHAQVARTSAETCQAAGVRPLSTPPGKLRKAADVLKAGLGSADVRAALKINRLAACEIARTPAIDAVLDISGFAYTDEQAQGAEIARRGLAWAAYCHRRAIPVYYLPQAWGPFRQPRVAAPVRAMGATAARLFARDGESLDHLARLLNGSGKSVEPATDIVFAFDGAPAAAGRHLLAELGLDPGAAPIVALTPSLRVYERTPGRGSDNAYVRQMVRIGRHLLQTAGCSLLVLPHEFATPGSGRADDRFVAALIAAQLRACGRCACAALPYPVMQTKAMLGAVDLVVGSRFHTLVLAAASGVPTVSLGWTHKYRHLMQAIGLDDFVVADFNYDEHDATPLVARAWDQRAASAEALAPRAARLRDDVAAFFDDLAGALARTPGGAPATSGVRGDQCASSTATLA